MRTEDFDAMHTYRGHLDQVLCVNFSYDNSCIVSGSLDKSIKVWGLPPIPPPEVRPLAFAVNRSVRLTCTCPHRRRRTFRVVPALAI